MNDIRKICVVITARPSYSRIKTVLKEINKHDKLKLQLIIAGSALIEKYGSVVDYIEKDGFEITEKVYNVFEHEHLTAPAKTTGNGIIELSTLFDKLKPSIVITVADRYETISTAIAASYMNIPLAHVQGGEVTGNIDEKVRHAITKLADYHFVSSEDAYKRVLKLGEEKQSIFNTGCPSIDLAFSLKKNNNLNFNPYDRYGGVGEKPNYLEGYWVVMQHPVTTEFKNARYQIEQTLRAVYELNETIFWFWPNIDSGSDGTSSGIRSFREKHRLKNFHFFKNMEPEDFLCLIKNSNGLIGNSSVGIRECSFLGIPSLNIGSRQNKRMQGKNVINTDYNKTKILDSIHNIKSNNLRLNSEIYGDGKSGKKIAKILSHVQLKFHKTISY